jgi:hypothetical protein
MNSVKTTTRTMTTTRHWYWHVRLYNQNGESPVGHKGWVVCVDEREILNPTNKPGRPKRPAEMQIASLSWRKAVEKVKKLGIDNGVDGEWCFFPEFTADILEFNGEGVAELY